MQEKTPKQLKPFVFKPKSTPEDIEVITTMKKAGQGRGDIFYVMMQRRPDVHSITIGRWIDSVEVEREVENEPIKQT